ncbi:hypothetical protein [Tabrizicola fusiformis]|uniref:hypothetical protein n=1 Tax=Tabrizicola sp. SY72 TaxID=2741673 RepID=UPI0015732D5F|nr:hypothetical protein [Tabrizicola sp. SY72]NTT84950.1 hypothetical protein [Tabrizicola sp. SY72]
MSEPLSAVEIEDVLSSIRRLVSDDLRPAARPMADPDAGKLILTPALRVVQETPPRAPDAAIESVVAGLGAAVDARAEDWESETGDPAPAAAAVSADSDWDIPPGPETADEAEVLAVQFHARPRSTLQPAEVIPAPVAEPVPGWAQEGEDEAPEPARWAAATIEPDAAWADEAEAQVLEELSDEIAAAAPLDRMAEAAEAAGYDAYEDEALRELVRDLIVEELQGPLGARITRNIRKLVRAEIARALAAEQLY